MSRKDVIKIPLFDFECPKCGNIEERIVHHSVGFVKCSKCQKGASKKIISVSGTNCFNDDSPWVRTVLEVVDKDSKAPHVVEFRKNPTRQNYKNWMKGEGLRHMEPGEERKPYTKDVDTTKLNKEVWEAHRERNRMVVR